MGMSSQLHAPAGLLHMTQSPVLAQQVATWTLKKMLLPGIEVQVYDSCIL
jgi:hypothetical protein